MRSRTERTSHRQPLIAAVGLWNEGLGPLAQARPKKIMEKKKLSKSVEVKEGKRETRLPSGAMSIPQRCPVSDGTFSLLSTQPSKTGQNSSRGMHSGSGRASCCRKRNSSLTRRLRRQTGWSTSRRAPERRVTRTQNASRPRSHCTETRSPVPPVAFSSQIPST
jgi:hypothetical protein